jgi:Neuraminidase (sialidase)
LEKWNRNNESRYPFTIRYNEGTSSALVACYDGTTFKSIGINGFPVNTWKQIVAVFDFVAKTLTVYRDGGNAVNTSLVGINQVSNTSPIAIATRLTTNGSAQSNIMFKGTIGIIRTYNIALSSDQVLQNFNANKIRFGL